MMRAAPANRPRPRRGPGARAPLQPCSALLLLLVLPACKQEPGQPPRGPVEAGLTTAAAPETSAPGAPAEPGDSPGEPGDEPGEPEPPAQGSWLRGETLSLRVEEATLLDLLRSGARVARPAPGHHFLRVRVTVQQRGQNPHRLRAARFWVRDSLGRDVPVAQAVQAAFSSTADELFLVAGMQEPFELLFELHDETRARWLVYSDAGTRLSGGLAPARDVPAPAPARGAARARALRSPP